MTIPHCFVQRLAVTRNCAFRHYSILQRARLQYKSASAFRSVLPTGLASGPTIYSSSTPPLTRSFASKKRRKLSAEKLSRLVASAKEEKPRKPSEKEISQLLAKVNDRLKDADRERYGKYRGRGSIYGLLGREEGKRQKKKQRKVPTEVAIAELLRLLYERHALRHGRRNLEEFDEASLAATFLGEKANVKMSLETAQTIVHEEFCFNRPSVTLKKFKEDNGILDEKLNEPEKKAEGEPGNASSSAT